MVLRRTHTYQVTWCLAQAAQLAAADVHRPERLWRSIEAVRTLVLLACCRRASADQSGPQQVPNLVAERAEFIVRSQQPLRHSLSAPFGPLLCPLRVLPTFACTNCCSSYMSLGAVMQAPDLATQVQILTVLLESALADVHACMECFLQLRPSDRSCINNAFQVRDNLLSVADGCSK